MEDPTYPHWKLQFCFIFSLKYLGLLGGWGLNCGGAECVQMKDTSIGQVWISGMIVFMFYFLYLQ